MTDQEIANALRAHLNGIPGAPPIVWENASGVWDGTNFVTPEPPFWVVSQIKTPPTRIGVSHTHERQGRMVVSVMAREGTSTAIAEASAEAILTQFPPDLRLQVSDGEINMPEAAYTDAGFNDGAYWRVNVHIRWRAYA